MSHVDQEKAAIFAEEAFVVDVQVFLNDLMENKGWSRADLARAMGVSRARISQIFSDECRNFTVRLLAKAVHAMGETVEVKAKGSRKRAAKDSFDLEAEASLFWLEADCQEVTASVANDNRLAGFVDQQSRISKFQSFELEEAA